MKAVSVTEFKAHCLRLMEEIHRTREPLQIEKRGRPLVVVSPPPPTGADWTPGAFQGTIVEVGDICVDGADLGTLWEAVE